MMNKVHSRYSRTSRRRSHQPSVGGFTLIEILVTVVLISVGLLGVAALQLTTLRGNQESYVRTQASVLSADILDRMRANATAARNGAYNVTWNGEGGGTGTQAGRDLRTWQATINSTLPGGNDIAAGDVQVQEVAERFIVTVRIRWNERPEGTGNPQDDAGGARTFMTRSEI